MWSKGRLGTRSEAVIPSNQTRLPPKFRKAVRSQPTALKKGSVMWKTEKNEVANKTVDDKSRGRATNRLLDGEQSS